MHKSPSALQGKDTFPLGEKLYNDKVDMIIVNLSVGQSRRKQDKAIEPTMPLSIIRYRSTAKLFRLFMFMAMAVRAYVGK